MPSGSPAELDSPSYWSRLRPGPRAGCVCSAVTDPGVTHYHVHWYPEVCAHNDTTRPGASSSTTQVSRRSHGSIRDSREAPSMRAELDRKTCRWCVPGIHRSHKFAVEQRPRRRLNTERSLCPLLLPSIHGAASRLRRVTRGRSRVQTGHTRCSRNAQVTGMPWGGFLRCTKALNQPLNFHWAAGSHGIPFPVQFYPSCD